jgi:hypothetical protein
MKNTTVTVDTTRLMKKAKKAIKAVKAFDKACAEFGSDPRDIVVSDLEVFGKRGDELIGNGPIEVVVNYVGSGHDDEWEKALVKTVTYEGGKESIAFHKWYPTVWEMIPYAAKESLTSYEGIAVVGGFGFRKRTRDVEWEKAQDGTASFKKSPK